MIAPVPVHCFTITSIANGYDVEKTVLLLYLGCFSSDLFLYLQVTRTCMKARTSLKFRQIRPPTAD